ncbi:MAG: hypothetical protein RIQ89_846 [Bacteroidota bacterium]|jgi:hypothetical protein
MNSFVPSLAPEEIIQQTDVGLSILHTLVYFDLFKHPLTANEIVKYQFKSSATALQISETLDELLRLRMIKNSNGYFSLYTSGEYLERRLNGERQSRKAMAIARHKSKIIALFPFVRGVAISGSLSKGYTDKDGDIDYFIITSPNRLWTCKLILMLYKKIFLLNSRKHFCLNYFISNDQLTIPDKNIFTAIEIAFLKCTYNQSQIDQFNRANSWIATFLPIHSFISGVGTNPYRESKIEWLFKGWVGNIFEKFSYKILKFHKSVKFKHYHPAQVNINLRSTSTASKHHPLGYQQRVLSAFAERCEKINSEYLASMHRDITHS